MLDAHKRRLAHAEMVHAFTTAAVINFSFAPPKEPVQPSAFMPNLHTEEEKPAPVRKMSENEVVEWQARVASLALEMKAGGGPMLEEIQRNASE